MKRRKIGIVLFMLCCLLAFAAPVFAAGKTVPVTVTTKNADTQTDGAQYQIIVTPQDSGTPEIANINVTEGEKGAIVLPAYSKVGTYRYTVAMLPSQKVVGVTYDTHTYELDVIVTNGQSGLVTTAVIANSKTGEKAAALKFVNHSGATPPGRPKTGDATTLALSLAAILAAGLVTAGALRKTKGDDDE